MHKSDFSIRKATKSAVTQVRAKLQHLSSKRFRRNTLQLKYGQLRRAKILTLSRQLAEHVEAQGLHSLFACLRTINSAVIFFCHTFAIHSQKKKTVFFNLT